MAYTALTPDTEIVEAQDAMGFKIYDKSTWTGESAITTDCWVEIAHIDDDEVRIEYDDYDLIPCGVKTKYNEFLSTDGHTINLSALTIGGAAVSDTIFPDGYYEITVKYTDGTYVAGSEPYYKNTQAFLAKYRCMKRKMPALLLTWPLTDEVRRKNYDIYTLGLYLDAAEDAADLAKKTQFRKFVALIRQIVDYYEIPDPLTA